MSALKDIFSRSFRSPDGKIIGDILINRMKQDIPCTHKGCDGKATVILPEKLDPEKQSYVAVAKCERCGEEITKTFPRLYPG